MKKTIATLLALISLSAMADSSWNAGYLQGTSTYTTSVGTSGYLALECPDDPRRGGPGIYFSPDGENRANAFDVIIDGNRHAIGFNKFETQPQFEAFYNALREAGSVAVVSQDTTYPISLKNIQVVVPPTDSPEFACLFPEELERMEEQAVAAAAPLPELSADDFEVAFFDMRTNRGLQKLPRNSLEITSKADNVKIMALIVNRGKCAINPGNWRRNDRFPTQLGFGDKAVYELAPTANCDNVLEFAIVTDHGTVAFAKQ